MDRQYYFESRPIGLFVLLTSLKEQPDALKFGDLADDFFNCALHAIVDWIYVFRTLGRLKKSIELGSRWDMALDGSSFFLFVRIYYDSLGRLIHLLFKAMNPGSADRWPKAHSFADQIKWFRKRESDPYFPEYVRCLEAHGFDESFRQMRSIRNRLKGPPAADTGDRLVWPGKDWFTANRKSAERGGEHTLRVCKIH